MKYILTISALLLSISALALAGTGYESCITEEKLLKEREAADCSGLNYLFNPSACFATQKALREYASGKCRQIGISEDVAASLLLEKPVKNVNGLCSVIQRKGDAEVTPQGRTLEQLEEENARLKAEISRLSAENELLRKADR